MKPIMGNMVVSNCLLGRPNTREINVALVYKDKMGTHIDVGTGGHWGHVPPRLCNKQRSALFLFRKFRLLLKEKSALEVTCPQV